MITPRLLLCSGMNLEDDDSRRSGRKVVELDALGRDPNVNIRLEPVSKRFAEQIPPRLTDLLEIASYVYAADTATHRGVEWTDDHSTEAWGRNFHFLIPVRDIKFWQRRQVSDLLTSIIRHLSDDQATFEFCELVDKRPIQNYLGFGDFQDWEFAKVDRVSLFSGGLDSLSGAVSSAAAGEKLVLVSHSPVNTMLRRQGDLFGAVQHKFSTPMIHIPVCINKDKKYGREHTQRTRSLLFASLGAVIGATLDAKGVRFFENGIVSINLPVADEVLRARASRTTHPNTLSLFTEFLTLVVGQPFIVDNPYLFKTKSEVVALIREHNCEDLIRHTCSCAHTGHFQGGSQWHCGTCSQCIDRRIAILGEGLEDYDRKTDYVCDVFLGARKDGDEKNMAVNYIRHAVELDRMNDVEIATRFNRDLSRSVRGFSNRSTALNDLVDLHKRHGSSVVRVIAEQIEKNSEDLAKGLIEMKSMLMYIVGREHLEPSWIAYSKRIEQLLATGLPIACSTVKPKTEPNLQEIGDAILKTKDIDLVREFPFMRWSSGSTKPDWSTEDLKLWVELKYVRTKKDLAPIREAIAADITKYGDSNRRVLFVIYDPYNHIVDKTDFAEPILTRDQMRVCFI